MADTAGYAIVSGTVLLSLFTWFGLRNARKASGGDLRAGLGYGPIQQPRLVALIIGLLLLYGFSIGFLDINPYPNLTRHIREMDAWLLVLAALLVGIGAPIAEEVFFRGWLWTALRKHWGVPATAIATALLWYAIHIGHGLVYMTMLVVPIIAITLVRHIGGSLRASILGHMIYNIYCVANWLVVAFVLEV